MYGFRRFEVQDLASVESKKAAAGERRHYGRDSELTISPCGNASA